MSKKATKASDNQDTAYQMLERILLIAKLISESDAYQKQLNQQDQMSTQKTQKI